MGDGASMKTGQRLTVDRHPLYGWVYYDEDVPGEQYPATSKPRAMESAIELAKATMEGGRFAEVYVREASDERRLVWPAPVTSLRTRLRKRHR